MLARQCFGIGLSSLLVACHSSTTPPAPASTPAATRQVSSAEVEAATATITAEFLRERVARISADEFAGRSPGTEGDRAARAYLQQQLAELKLEPGLPGPAWEQPVELVSVISSFPKLWSFERPGRELALAWWEQYIAGSGVHTPGGELKQAEVVFAGYGIQAPEYAWDDFKGQDLKGKLLVLLNNDPDWDPQLFAGKTRLYYGRWTYKYENAARLGAAGALIIHTQESAGYPFQVVQSSWGGETFELPASADSALGVKGWLTEDAARKLVELGGHDLEKLRASARSRDFKPVSLGVKSSVRFTNELGRAQSANVLGVLRGSDPRLAEEYVVLSAHHDHLGVGKPDASGDAIYNGALDNGAGMATVLSIVRALRALPRPPRRSILVIFVTAEEQNLLGSRYYLEHSSVPAVKMVANVNFDGGNIWGKTRDLSQIGHGKSSLDALVRELAAEQERVVKPDEFPDRGFFYRSDQLNFARAGVPALYLDIGTDFVGRPPDWGTERILEYETKHYHQPSDELTPDWNFDGMVQDAQLGFRIALSLANAEQGPTWNPGDEFEAVRAASIAKSP